MDRENIDENYNAPARLQLCNTVVLRAYPQIAIVCLQQVKAAAM